MNTDVAKELIKTFEELNHNDDVKVIILTGEGEKAFSAGADIEYMSKISADESVEYARTGQLVTSSFATSVFIALSLSGLLILTVQMPSEVDVVTSDIIICQVM